MVCVQCISLDLSPAARIDHDGILVFGQKKIIGIFVKDKNY